MEWEDVIQAGLFGQRARLDRKTRAPGLKIIE